MKIKFKIFRMAKVTPENFVRVETNRNFKIYGDMVGGTNRFYHKREFGESNASGEFLNYRLIPETSDLKLYLSEIKLRQPLLNRNNGSRCR